MTNVLSVLITLIPVLGDSNVIDNVSQPLFYISEYIRHIMNHENLKIQLEHELHYTSVPVYKKFLKRALLEIPSVQNYALINEILQNLVLPDECFSWCATFRNISPGSIRLLVDRKLELDKLVESVISSPKISGNQIVDSLPLNIKIYMTNLLNSKAVHRNIIYVINESICESAQYANVNALEIFIDICIEKSIECKFNPYEDTRHKQIYRWIMGNIQKGEGDSNAILGWTCGPDSAIWPSTQLIDYKKTYELLLKIMSTDDSARKKKPVKKYVVW
uniref:Uncharacterized protein n=1 Tax=Photinus pyralis TaxID=7054 RepID=A0A1Y1LC04_PHOPY